MLLNESATHLWAKVNLSIDVFSINQSNKDIGEPDLI